MPERTGYKPIVDTPSAVSADPDRAGGLDAALRAVGRTAPGVALLVVIATGFAAYGVFCVVDAATRRA